jgi:hypothetical protein
VPKVGRTAAAIPKPVARPTSRSLKTAAGAETPALRTRRCARTELASRVVRRRRRRCVERVVRISNPTQSVVARATTAALPRVRTPRRRVCPARAASGVALASRNAATTAWIRRATPSTAVAAIERARADRCAALASAFALPERTTVAEAVRRTIRRCSADRVASLAGATSLARSTFVPVTNVLTSATPG